MPVGIAPSDRKLLLACSALLVVMLALTAIFAQPSGVASSPVPSTFSNQSQGAEAAYLLLTHLHYPVRRWESPPSELPLAQAKNTLLILAEPTEPPSSKESQAVADFVKDGGHVLFTGNFPVLFFAQANISETPPDPKPTTFAPNFPSHLSRQAPRITIQPQAYWGDLNESQLALYGPGQSHAVVAWRFGQGQIVWWCGSTPLTNAGISQADNLQFFLNSVTNPDNEKPYQIYWDEYFHGERNSLLSYVRKPALLAGVAQIGLIATAVLFTFSRRTGPIYVPPPVSRLSPLEFVDTLGGLYERAHAASAAVLVSYSRLRFLLSRQLALPTDISNSGLGFAAEERLGWKDFQKENLLERAKLASREPKLRDQAALQLVRDLEKHSANLAPRANTRQEKR